MNRFATMSLRTFVLGALFILLTAIPTLAQENPPLGPGEGLPVVVGNFGGDIATTNPILVSDGPSQTVVTQLFPLFIGLDPDTGLYAPGIQGSLATGWSTSEDGLVLTIKLRTDMTWSDGTPITSSDVKYAYDAVVSGEVDTPIASYLSTVESLEAPDAETVVVTFSTAECTAVDAVANVPVVPAQYYQTIYPTFADMTAESEYNLQPEVSAGAFKFQNFRPGEQVTLLADQNYKDSDAGWVVPEGWVYKTVQDQLVEIEQFIAGDITYTNVPEDRDAEMKERAANGEFQIHLTPSTGWQVILFNTANPENPQNGLDENGERIEQDPHPIFSDARVRLAFVHAINHDALNKGAFNGTGQAVGGAMLPQSWAYNENIQPYTYDPELSMQLLDEAGFVDDDNNPDTPRVATEDALYAEPGTPLEFDLTTFTGNLSVDASSVLIQDQLKQVGFKMNLDIIEFTPMLDKLLGQSYDALMVFWGVTPSRPQEMRDQLAADADVVNAGFNTGSYYNPEFEALMEQARILPGCDQAERKALYDQAQQIIYDEAPYYLVNTSIVPIVVQNNVEGWAPKKNSFIYNLPSWSLRP